MKTPTDAIADRLVALSDELGGRAMEMSVDEIAEAADIPRATLYYYFSGKDDLVAFFVNNKLGRVATAIAKAAAGEGSATERLSNSIRSIVAAMVEHPALCTELPEAVKRAGQYAEVATHADRVVMAPMRELLTEGRATGELAVPDVAVAAQAIAGAIMNATQAHLTMSDDPVDAELLGDQLAATLVEGLRART
jgi:TetR/AcrR family transcriptional regulator